MRTILEQLEYHHLFRRVIILMLLAMCWHTLVMGFDLATQAKDAIESGNQLAAVLGAMQAILALVLAKALSLYDKSRREQKERKTEPTELDK